MAEKTIQPTFGKLIFGSSIGRKQLMAVTGLSLCGFLVPHLTGNLLLIKGEEAFNAYAVFLHSIPGFIYVEFALALMFILHIYLGISLTMENRKARSSRYAVNGSKGAINFANKTMPLTGIWILIFLVAHVVGLRLNPEVMTSPEGVNVFQIIDQMFANPAIVGFYVFSSCVLGFHVGHGFQSAFQTLGLVSNGFTPFIKKVSVAFGFLMAIGYSVLPIYMFLT